MLSSEALREPLVKLGAVAMLFEALTNPPERIVKATEVLYAVKLDALRALAMLATVEASHEAISERLEDVETFARDEDARLRAAAESVLAELRGPAQPEADGGGEAFDVFISHKRTDAKDFARALYNLLTMRGFKCFLDFEFREELNDLEAIVERSTNLIFVLTDLIFDSAWCLKELAAAVKSKKNVVLITKEGSRWLTAAGQRCDFPPQEKRSRRCPRPSVPRSLRRASRTRTSTTRRSRRR